MFSHLFDPAVWAAVPFHFWSAVMFLFGAIVGSFLNVCIHRLPYGHSIISPPSHCPHCKYSIPWYLNVPVATWLYLRGKCRNCGAPISVRYLVVEALTGLTFAGCWMMYGRASAALALIYAFFLAGLIVATFIDFEHFIIPDELTIGGMAAGFVCSFVAPRLHGGGSLTHSLTQSLLGIGFGAGLVYFILRAGKLAFGRHKVALPAGSKVVFTETALVLPTEAIPYEDLFYRASDVIALQAQYVELADRCYQNVLVRLSLRSNPALLRIGDEELNPEEVPHLEAVSAEIVLPREAMGLGDVKFMAAIGAFLGPVAVVFCLMLSSVIGSVVGLTLIAFKKRAWSSRLPYGPYIALAAAIWIFGAWRVAEWWLNRR